LQRNNTNSSPSWTEIAKVNLNGAVVSASDLAGRATITGAVSPVSSAQLKLTIQAKDVNCTDAVTYQCVVLGTITGNSAYTDTAEKYIGMQSTLTLLQNVSLLFIKPLNMYISEDYDRPVVKYPVILDTH